MVVGGFLIPKTELSTLDNAIIREKESLDIAILIVANRGNLSYLRCFSLSLPDFKFSLLLFVFDIKFFL